jgi:hypothetical protein
MALSKEKSMIGARIQEAARHASDDPELTEASRIDHRRHSLGFVLGSGAAPRFY